MNEKLTRVRKELELLEDSIIFNGLYRFSYKTNINNYMEQFNAHLNKKNNFASISFDTINFIDADYIFEKMEVIKSKIIFNYVDFINKNSSNFNQTLYDISYIISIDNYILNTIYKRICLGIDVAQSKFDYNPEEYKKLIINKNHEALMTLLTDLKKEDEVVERVKNKTIKYLSILNLDIPSDIFTDFYKSFIIPITKDLEIDFLLSFIFDY